MAAKKVKHHVPTPSAKESAKTRKSPPPGAKYKDNFKVGDRVTAKRSHDKNTVITGTVVALHENDDDCLDIQTEPDGKAFEVSTLETVHAKDVQPAPPATAEQKAATAKAVADAKE